MTHSRHALLALMCLLTPSIAGAQYASPGSPAGSSGDADVAKRVDTIANQYWAAFVEAFPVAALFLGVPEAPNDQVGDNSLAAVRAWQAREDGWLRRLKEIDAHRLAGRSQDATYGVLLET